MNQNTRLEPPLRASPLEDEAAIETIMNFDPYAEFDLLGDQINNGIASAMYPFQSGPNVAKPIDKVHGSTEATEVQFYNGVPPLWDSLPGFDDPNVFRPVVESTGTPDLTQSAFINDLPEELLNDPIFSQNPTSRAHGALQQTLFEDDMHVGASSTTMRNTLPHQLSREPSPRALQNPSSLQHDSMLSFLYDDLPEQSGDWVLEQLQYPNAPSATQAPQSASEPPSTVKDTVPSSEP